MIRSGLDVLVEDKSALVRGRAVGLLCHPASVTGRLEHARSALERVGARLVALFGPEHGIGGAAQDMEAVGSEVPASAVPTYSLYGSSEDSLSPAAEWLEEVDVLLIDLQDVGSRYYTYVWTAALTLQVCAEVGVQVLLLDRPNPIGGAAIEGPGIAPGFSSFVGLYDVPVRHGMTCGELMRMVEREQRLSIDFEVIPMQGWRREQSFEDTGLPWVLPSPNMPTVDTAFVYPGGCLLEATNISEGRGTTRPFEIFGAPWIDAEALAGHINRSALPGVRARPLSFKPTFQKHAGEPCGGVQLHVLDRRAFRPFATGVAILGLIIAQYQQFAWREQPYEFVTDIPAIDLLAGGRWLRERQLAGDWRALADSWRDPEQRFAQRRAPFLLY